MGDGEEERRAFEIPEDARRPVGPGAEEEQLSSSFDPTRLDFGHYAGQTIEELAGIDPDYLRWLAKHPSGVRYRAEIHRVLGTVPLSTDWER